MLTDDSKYKQSYFSLEFYCIIIHVHEQALVKNINAVGFKRKVIEFEFNHRSFIYALHLTDFILNIVQNLLKNT